MDSCFQTCGFKCVGHENTCAGGRDGGAAGCVSAARRLLSRFVVGARICLVYVENLVIHMLGLAFSFSPAPSCCAVPHSLQQIKRRAPPPRAGWWPFSREKKGQLSSQLAKIAAARAAGDAVPARRYADVLRACALDPIAPAALYRLWEEALVAGVRPSELDADIRAALRGRVPPEPESEPLLAPLPDDLGVLHNDPLPSLWVRPSRYVYEVDCSDDAGVEAAWAAVEKAEQPVLFRGVGQSWPARHTWTLPRLARFLPRGMVRVAPNAAVTFCRESHSLVRAGEFTPPSRVVAMRGAEFVQRLRRGRGGLPPLLYGEDERAYLQALAPRELMADVDFSFLPAPNADGVLGRLWVSAPGTYSPLHYDEQASYLCQVRGRKRMILWPARVLDALQPYPADHPLARRLRLPITGTSPPKGESATALREVADAAMEAQLGPGDVLYFPEGWAHHTEAVGDTDEDTTAAAVSWSLGFRTDGTYLL